MHDYNYLIAIALILVSTKFFGSITKKINLPQVVGALVAGIIIGPTGLNLIGETDFLIKTAEIGVIMLMFMAGIDTELEELKKTGFSSILIACFGVILPLIAGACVYYFFYTDVPNITQIDVLKGAFIGVVLTATSVSITVETLREMGVLKGKMGTAIVGAAIIDDIIGIVMLTVISSFKSPDVHIGGVIIKIFAYFIFLGIVGYIAHKVFVKLEKKYIHMKRVVIYAFAFCLTMAWISEVIFGIADITGAYFAGLILCNIMEGREFIAKKFSVTSYMIFAPVFFASIGVKTDLREINSTIIVFSLVLLIVAILSKFIGCSFAARISGFRGKAAAAIGIGMVSRGEVALIVAQKGERLGLVDSAIFPAIVLVVVVTTLITPILLKLLLGHGSTGEDQRIDNKKEEKSKEEKRVLA